MNRKIFKNKMLPLFLAVFLSFSLVLPCLAADTAERIPEAEAQTAEPTEEYGYDDEDELPDGAEAGTVSGPAEETDASPEPTPPLIVETPDYHETGLDLVDEEELEAVLAPLFETYNLSEKNFALAFYYTGTGESYFYNAEKFMIAGSLYKVPMCMQLAERISSGEYTLDSLFLGNKISNIFTRAIIYSENDISRRVRQAMAVDGSFWLPLLKYGGYQLDELPPECLAKDYFSARLVLNTFLTLYNDPERFPYLMDYLLKAQPENYFHLFLKDTYEIAQKYGSLESGLNAAGVIFTPRPIILVVMTDHITKNHECIGRVAEAMAGYALTLDEKQTAIEEEEASRLAAEKEARRAAEEAERLAAEEAAHQAEEARLATEEPNAQPETAAPAEESAEAAGTNRTLLFIYSGAAVLLLGVWAVRTAVRKRRRTNE